MNQTSNRFVITHRTRYEYSEPVAMCQNQVMMVPRELPRVRCHASTMNIVPKPSLSHSHVDY